MSDQMPRLKSSPIMEAVVDVECQFAPEFSLLATEADFKSAFGDLYPKFHAKAVEHHKIIATDGEAAKSSFSTEINALQAANADATQIIQARIGGYTFNRMAPYSSFDHYLPEIERTWREFIEIAKPVKVIQIRLRCINRILLPIENQHLELNDYLKNGPRLPIETDMWLTGYISHQTAKVRATSDEVNLLLTGEPPEGDILPTILDIGVARKVDLSPHNWEGIHKSLTDLRALKNKLFCDSLTEKCLSLF